MLRRSLPSIVAAVVLALGGAATARAEPKIAILGLEVIDNGSIDEATTRSAQLLTEELRKEATRPGGKYSLAPNSAKDLLELKLLSDCSDEGRGCMSAIGQELGADRLLYGKLERRSDGYQVSLRLLDTDTEQMEKTTSELIPPGELGPGSAGKWARLLYGRLTGAPTAGSIHIEVNADRGTVYVDGEVTTTLSDGSAKVLGLGEGTHQVVIEAPGYRRYDAQVAVGPGEAVDLSVSLQATGAGAGDDLEEPGKGWRMAFLGGVLVTGGMTAGWVYNGLRVRGSLADDKEAAWASLQASPDAQTVLSAMNEFSSEPVYGDNGEVVSYGDACSAAEEYAATNPSIDPSSRGALTEYVDRCEDGTRAALLTNVFIGATVASAALTAYFGYRGWFGDGRSSRESRGERRVRFAPSLSPDGVGAALAIEF